jgi:hypothetical protein
MPLQAPTLYLARHLLPFEGAQKNRPDSSHNSLNNSQDNSQASSSNQKSNRANNRIKKEINSLIYHFSPHLKGGKTPPD